MRMHHNVKAGIRIRIPKLCRRNCWIVRVLGALPMLATKPTSGKPMMHHATYISDTVGLGKVMGDCGWCQLARPARPTMTHSPLVNIASSFVS